MKNVNNDTAVITITLKWEDITRFDIAPFNLKSGKFAVIARGQKGSNWVNLASVTGHDTDKYQFAVCEDQAYIWLGELMTAHGIAVGDGLKKKIAKCAENLKNAKKDQMLKKIRIVNAGEKAYLESEREKAIKRFGKMKKEVAEHNQAVARKGRKNPIKK